MNTQKSRLLILISSATLAVASVLGAQIPRNDKPVTIGDDRASVVTPALLARVAAAVDGHRTGRPLFVVASYRFPHQVLGVFQTIAEAKAVLSNSGRDYGVFGPFIAPSDGVPGDIVWGIGGGGDTIRGGGGGCKKGPDSDCIGGYGPKPRPLSQLASATLIVRAKDGTIDSVPFDPNKVEALFFTMSSIDRLLIPYYVRIYGVEHAAQLRQQFLNRLRESETAILHPSAAPAP